MGNVKKQRTNNREECFTLTSSSYHFSALPVVSPSSLVGQNPHPFLLPRCSSLSCYSSSFSMLNHPHQNLLSLKFLFGNLSPLVPSRGRSLTSSSSIGSFPILKIRLWSSFCVYCCLRVFNGTSSFLHFPLNDDYYYSRCCYSCANRNNFFFVVDERRSFRVRVTLKSVV